MMNVLQLNIFSRYIFGVRIVHSKIIYGSTPNGHCSLIVSHAAILPPSRIHCIDMEEKPISVLY